MISRFRLLIKLEDGRGIILPSKLRVTELSEAPNEPEGFLRKETAFRQGCRGRLLQEREITGHQLQAGRRILNSD